MPPFDLIICFDQAIFEMHVWETLAELGVKKGEWAQKQSLEQGASRVIG
ncbi:hypothetical protein J2TS4_12520 [Paenibacillus sp. J2TS4]|nr:hypothetical protein J2TS4_12520 [Paenibacillus sp. J2TS4]